MSSATSEFDALAATRRLVTAGIERRQAEVIAVAVRNGRVGLATKADLDNLEARLDARFDSLEARLNARIDARIAGLETRTLRVAVAIVLAQSALTAVLAAGLTFGLLEMFGGA